MSSVVIITLFQIVISSSPEGEGVNLAIVKRSDDVTKTKLVKLWNKLA